MRKIVVMCALVSSLALVSESYAQSGSRGGGGGGGGAVRSSGGGGGGARSSGRSRSGGGGLSRRARQPSPAEIARAIQKQREDAALAAKLQAEFAQEQFKQTLAQLALRENRSANSRQYRTAFREAKNDFKGLRSGDLAPEHVGVLQTPFRLSDQEIDRTDGMVQWPDALGMGQFAELVEGLEATIANGVSNAETASQFFSELERLNTAVNQAAANREIDSSTYATARRFVTGLANEIRATDLGDLPANQSS